MVDAQVPSKELDLSVLREKAEGLRHNALIFRDLNQRSRERQLYDSATAICDAADEIERLQAEVAAWKTEADLNAHRVITCGVAARHPDPNLTRTGAYAGKWDSQQAEEVRKLRADRDRLTRAAHEPPADTLSMSSVGRKPTPGESRDGDGHPQALKSDTSGTELSSFEAPAEQVHRVCQWMRDEVGPHVGAELKCQQCPLVIESPYGPGTQACVMRAQELIAIVRPAQPQRADTDACCCGPGLCMLDRGVGTLDADEHCSKRGPASAPPPGADDAARYRYIKAAWPDHVLRIQKDGQIALDYIIKHLDSGIDWCMKHCPTPTKEV